MRMGSSDFVRLWIVIIPDESSQQQYPSTGKYQNQHCLLCWLSSRESLGPAGECRGAHVLHSRQPLPRSPPASFLLALLPRKEASMAGFSSLLLCFCRCLAFWNRKMVDGKKCETSDHSVGMTFSSLDLTTFSIDYGLIAFRFSFDLTFCAWFYGIFKSFYYLSNV